MPDPRDRLAERGAVEVGSRPAITPGGTRCSRLTWSPRPWLPRADPTAQCLGDGGLSSRAQSGPAKFLGRRGLASDQYPILPEDPQEPRTACEYIPQGATFSLPPVFGDQTGLHCAGVRLAQPVSHHSRSKLAADLDIGSETAVPLLARVAGAPAASARITAIGVPLSLVGLPLAAAVPLITWAGQVLTRAFASMNG
jgi:hypothetical protein